MDGRKRSANGVNGKVFAVIAVIILIIYLAYNIIRLIMKPTDTFMVEEGTLELSEMVDAYVIRNETVLQGDNYENGMEKVVAEGKRVAKGDSVFRYYVDGENSIKDQIAALDNEIVEAQKNESVIYTTDIETLKSKISDLEEKIYDTNNIEEIENYKKEIDDYTYKIATIVGDLSPNGSHLKELINQKTDYLNQLTNGAEDIKAGESGTVSYRIDNMEEIFKTDDFSYLSSEFLENLNLKTGELVETNNEKGKIITDFYCYLAIEMNSDAAKDAEVGDTVKIQYDSDSTVSSEVVFVKDDGDSKIIVFKVNDLSEKLINYRKISVEVIWWVYKGLKVPNSAIIEDNGKYYIERNRSGNNVKVLVKILKQNDAYAIVETYTTQELQEMGYSYSEIQNMYSLKEFDEIVVEK